MQKKNIILASTIGLMIFVLTIGFAFNASAQTNINNNQNKFGQQLRMRSNLTPEQREAIEAKRQANFEAMEKAINSGNYNTWVETVKAQFGDQAPILSKITADNFSQFVEAHKLMIQAREKLQNLGITNGMGFARGNRGMCNFISPIN